MSSFSRLNPILNNSELRHSTHDNRSNLDALWNDIVLNNDVENDKQRNNGNGSNIPLRRLLAQTHSYSSDSSTSPQGIYGSCFSPQLSSRGSGVFVYSDDSQPTDSGSNRQSSFSYSSTPGSYANMSLRLSSLSDSGSPTLDDALVRKRLSDPFFQSNGNSMLPSTCKGQELTLPDLSSLSLNERSPTPSRSTLLSEVTGSSNRPSLSSEPSSLPSTSLIAPTSSSVSSSLANSLGLHNYDLNGNSQSTLGQGLNASQSQLLSPAMDLNSLTQFQNMWLTSQLLPNLVDSTNLLGRIGNVRDYRGPSSSPHLASPLSSVFPDSDPYAIEKAARMHRSAAALCDATCTWSGTLPLKLTKNPFYSCKVFLGGVPWDLTEVALRQTFLQFGNIQVEWPRKESSVNPPRGYVYILFENEKQVKSLVAACTQEFNSENYFYKISSRRMRQKENLTGIVEDILPYKLFEVGALYSSEFSYRKVQVIPWVISDSNYVRCPSYQLDPAKTVFVGALHGMLSAEGLANIMNDLFGGVVYSGIDTDKHKYPIGSGRVTFNNVHSYRKAVRAAFIEIKTPRFTKKVQVDPYLADSPCQLCGSSHGPYFCRDEMCFKYYCRACWLLSHTGEVNTHKPLMRDPKLRTQTAINRIF